MSDMTTEEWRGKSDDWRFGWKVCQDGLIPPENITEDFVAGYMYALEHPFGPTAVPM